MTEERFWESDEQVRRFAEREPDQRLLRILDEYPDPRDTRVLDLGCAGGRNAVLLSQRGFDFIAIDSSQAMVTCTRQRVAEFIGADEAAKRVTVGRMEALGQFEVETFHLIVALGVYHNAGNGRQWTEALAETARVLKRNGRVLVASFGPRSDPTGEGLRRVPGEAHVYDGFASGPLYLVEADALDREMARHGLLPLVPSDTVDTKTERGCRVTVNALYVKRDAG